MYKQQNVCGSPSPYALNELHRKEKSVRIENEPVQVDLRSECKESASSNEDTDDGGANSSRGKSTVTTTVERTGRNDGRGTRGG